MTPASGNHPASTQKLIAMLKDSDENVRLCAALQLGSMGKEAHTAIAGLIDLLRSGTVIDRRVAALVLGSIGPSASDAVPQLLVAMKEAKKSGVSQYAAEALEKITSKVGARRAA